MKDPWYLGYKLFKYHIVLKMVVSTIPQCNPCSTLHYYIMVEMPISDYNYDSYAFARIANSN